MQDTHEQGVLHSFQNPGFKLEIWGSTPERESMWVVILSWESPLNEPPPFPNVVLEDAEQLRGLLWSKAKSEPYIYHLRRRTNPDPSIIYDQLGLCLGGEWGLVDRSWKVGSVRSYRTAQPQGVGNPDEVCFQDGREGVYFQPGRLLPVAKVIDAALYFFEHGELTPLLQWVGWEK